MRHKTIGHTVPETGLGVPSGENTTNGGHYRGRRQQATPPKRAAGVIVSLLVAIAAAVAAPEVAAPAAVAAAEDAGVHQPAVDALQDRFEGIFDGTGCDDGSGLCPSDPLQRWEMAVWLIRVIEDQESPEPATLRFVDVGDGVWWAAHTERLAELEITVGCSTRPPRYCPQQPVTRAQMATFLVRAFDLPPGPAAGFADVAATPHTRHQHRHASRGRGHRRMRHQPGPLLPPKTGHPRTDGHLLGPGHRHHRSTPTRTTHLHDYHSRRVPHLRPRRQRNRGPAGATAKTARPAHPSGTHTAVAAGGFHTCALEPSGSVECWGYNEDGQTSPPSGTHTAITAGGFHTCAITTAGTIRCWGDNTWTQSNPPTGSYTAVAAGWQHTCALATDRSVECWGNNDRGQTDPPTWQLHRDRGGMATHLRPRHRPQRRVLGQQRLGADRPAVWQLHRDRGGMATHLRHRQQRNHPMLGQQHHKTNHPTHRPPHHHQPPAPSTTALSPQPGTQRVGATTKTAKPTHPHKPQS